MKLRLPAVMVGVSMLFVGFQSVADDNVCIINNASVAITAKGGEGTDTTEYNIPANGGDENKCWAFGIGAGAAYYEIDVMWGDDIDVGNFITVGFTDPDFGPGYFTTEAEGEGSEWAPNDKRCSGEVCIWHTGKTDVWRLYVENAPAQQEDCESPLSPCYNG